MMLQQFDYHKKFRENSMSINNSSNAYVAQSHDLKHSRIKSNDMGNLHSTSHAHKSLTTTLSIRKGISRKTTLHQKEVINKRQG